MNRSVITFSVCLIFIAIAKPSFALSGRYSLIFAEGEVIGNKLIQRLSARHVSRNENGDLGLGIEFSNQSGFFVGPHLLAQDGDVIDGKTIVKIQFPEVNSSGDHAFLGTFQTVDGQGELDLSTGIFLNGDLVVEAGNIIAGQSILGFVDFSLADDGSLVFIAILPGPSNGSVERALIKDSEVVAREGQTIADQVLGKIHECAHNSLGEIIFTTEVSTGEDPQLALFDKFGPRVSPGDTISDLTLQSVRSPSINDSRQVVIVGEFVHGGQPSEGIFSENSLLFRVGEQIDFVVIQEIYSVFINPNGELSFGVRIRDNYKGVVSPVDVLSSSEASPTVARLSETKKEQLFKLPLITSVGFKVKLHGPNINHVDLLTYKSQRPPIRASFDKSLVYPETTVNDFTFPVLRDGVRFLRVHGRDLTSEPVDIELSFEPISMAISDLSIRGSAREVIDVAISGGGFTADHEFSLKHSDGTVVEPTESLFVSHTRVEVRFDLTGAPIGTYDAIVMDPLGQTESLNSSFEVIEGTSRGFVEMEVIGVDYARYNRTGRFDVVYTNRGDYPIKAPLFKIEGPPGTRFSLAQRRHFQPQQLLVLGTHAGGVPGILPPGEGGRIPIYFKSSKCSQPGPEEDPHCFETPVEDCPCKAFPNEECTFCDLRFRISTFEPGPNEVIGWDLIDPIATGITNAGWAEAWPQLSQYFGVTWREFHLNLIQIANRLARRGINPQNVLSLYRFVVADALGRPSSAIMGRVLRDGTRRPVAGATLVAFDEDDRAVSTTRTDQTGSFALSWLENQKEYRLAVVDQAITSTNVSLSDRVMTAYEGDLLGLEVFTQPEDNDVEPGCENCNLAGLPTRAMFPPDGFFIEKARQEMILVSSWDPNEKDGPVGEGEDNLIPPDEEIVYTIYFENLPAEEGEIVAAANLVTLEDELDIHLDLDTFEPREFRIGSDESQVWSFNLSGQDRFSGYAYEDDPIFDSDSYYEEVRVRQILPDPDNEGETIEKEYEVQVYVNLERDTRTLRVSFQSQFNPWDPLGGFLVPNDDLRQGEGQFSFSIRTMADIEDGTDVSNDALIGFDNNPEQILTPEWTNVVTTEIPPQTPNSPAPVHEAHAVELDQVFQWVSENAMSYQISLWRMEGDVEQLIYEDDMADAYFTPRDLLEMGKRYEWQIVAENEFGESTSERWAFTAMAEAGCPGAVTEPSPLDQEFVDLDSVTLSWAEVENAAAYSLYLWLETETRPDHAIVSGIVNPSFNVDDYIQPGNSYKWQVIPFSSVDCEIEGPVWVFDYRTGEQSMFKRMDVDVNGVNEITDSIYLLTYLFLGDAQLNCEAAADVNADNKADITDAINILSHLFLGTFDPADPFESCGFEDGTSLGCDSYPPCEGEG